jgi:hypothetical protein
MTNEPTVHDQTHHIDQRIENVMDELSLLTGHLAEHGVSDDRFFHLVALVSNLNLYRDRIEDALRPQHVTNEPNREDHTPNPDALALALKSMPGDWKTRDDYGPVRSWLRFQELGMGGDPERTLEQVVTDYVHNTRFDDDYYVLDLMSKATILDDAAKRMKKEPDRGPTEHIDESLVTCCRLIDNARDVFNDPERFNEDDLNAVDLAIRLMDHRFESFRRESEGRR